MRTKTGKPGAVTVWGVADVVTHVVAPTGSSRRKVTFNMHRALPLFNESKGLQSHLCSTRCNAVWATVVELHALHLPTRAVRVDVVGQPTQRVDIVAQQTDRHVARRAQQTTHTLSAGLVTRAARTVVVNS